jgi:hypothetical protein
MSSSVLVLQPNNPLMGNLLGTKQVSRAMTTTGQQLLRILREIRKIQLCTNPNNLVLKDPTLKAIDGLLNKPKILQPAKAHHDCICEGTIAKVELLGSNKLILFDHFQFLNNVLSILPLTSKDHDFKHLHVGEYGKIAEVPCRIIRILSKEELEKELLGIKLMHTYNRMHA